MNSRTLLCYAVFSFRAEDEDDLNKAWPKLHVRGEFSFTEAHYSKTPGDDIQNSPTRRSRVFAIRSTLEPERHVDTLDWVVDILDDAHAILHHSARAACDNGLSALIAYPGYLGVSALCLRMLRYSSRDGEMVLDHFESHEAFHN